MLKKKKKRRGAIVPTPFLFFSFETRSFPTNFIINEIQLFILDKPLQASVSFIECNQYMSVLFPLKFDYNFRQKKEKLIRLYDKCIVQFLSDTKEEEREDEEENNTSPFFFSSSFSLFPILQSYYQSLVLSMPCHQRPVVFRSNVYSRFNCPFLRHSPCLSISHQYAHWETVRKEIRSNRQTSVYIHQTYGQHLIQFDEWQRKGNNM